MRKLTRAAFMEWLKSFSAKKVVGTSCKADVCPIGMFLGEGYGLDYSNYGRLDEWNESPLEERSRPVPAWARKFAHLIDETFHPHGFPEAHDITAARALEVLRKAR